MPNPIARCLKIAGTWPSGVMLYRLSYWQAKTKIRDGAYLWVVMSSDEWLAETTCTPKEHINAVKRLKDMGLIETLHRFRRGKYTAYFRLTDLAKEAISAPEWKAPKGTPPTEWMSPEGIPFIDWIASKGTPSSDWIAPAGNLTKSEVKKEGDKEEVSWEPSVPGSVQGGVGKSPETMEGLSEMKVSDVVAGAGKKPVSLKKHGVSPTAKMEIVWKKSIAETYGQKMVVLTQKNLGQLSAFRDLCTGLNPLSTLEWLIVNWVEFTVQAKSDHGLFKVPAIPDTGFLLKYASTALTVFQGHTSPKSSPVPPEPSMQQPKIVASVPQQDDDDEKPLTLAEILALEKAEKGEGG